MPVFTVIDKNHKVLQLYGASEEAFEGASLAIRPIRSNADILHGALNTGALAAALNTVDVYTVPANYVLELRHYSIYYLSAGTATFHRIQSLAAGGNIVIFNARTTFAINEITAWTGSAFLRAGYKLQAVINVTGANAVFHCSYNGILQPDF